VSSVDSVQVHNGAVGEHSSGSLSAESIRDLMSVVRFEVILATSSLDETLVTVVETLEVLEEG